MSDQRVSMFISHKVATHKRAAARIKTILEARTERLDVYICEEIPVGDRWREWITEPPRDADAAFIGFCKKWYEKRGAP